MYRGFNVIDIRFQKPSSLYEEIGRREKKRIEDLVSETINESINGIMDGDAMQANWFPQVEADIFISHSHSNEQLALSIAGWLKKEFGLVAFVDSTIWGHSNKLLKVLDNYYCYDDANKTYSYRIRNLTTTHVHLMLCSALSKMMDKCECLFFLNTPEAITSRDIVHDGETFSPWLYYELGISKLIQKTLSEHSSRKNIFKSKNFSDLNESQRQLLIKHRLEMQHLKIIDADVLNNWEDSYNREIPREEYPLDVLYDM